MKFTSTSRGFGHIAFLDRYGHQCSMQESRLASEAAIWFGVDDAKPLVMAVNARAAGVATTETVGWVPYPIPQEVMLTTRMHLTQAQVAALLPVLQHFVATGALLEPAPTYAVWRGGQEGGYESLPASELTHKEREDFGLPFEHASHCNLRWPGTLNTDEDHCDCKPKKDPK